MRPHTPLAPHLTTRQLRQRFRRCKDATAKTHWQVLWLRSSGKTTSEVADTCGYKPDWVRRLVRRFNALGPESIGDRRRNNRRELLLDEEQRAELLEALSGRAPDGGLWNGPKVTRWIEERLGERVGKNCGWEYLRRLGLTAQVPRPRHIKADPEAQKTFKKNSGNASSG